ncbi:MAG: MBL fold metallo-hydrolase [Candidatus Thorarchaeota archaeon]|nr:MBL fold metallo-hydrolase [Candidatus Thorarchaeota archaeon]
MDCRVILLGTGTPNPDPKRSGPSVAIVSDDSVYIVDFGPGVVRQAAAAGIKMAQLKRAFLTHLHSDHTVGYPDLIYTPAVTGRIEPLEVYGPPGLNKMTEYIKSAYAEDIEERLSGLEPAIADGYVVNAVEIAEGIVYQDLKIAVEAFTVDHGSLEAFGYKFSTPEKTIVVSGDTRPSPKLIENAKGCDVLIHEVYTAVGLLERSEEWKKYHRAVHTSTYELAKIANIVKPSLLVLYHQLMWNRTEIELVQEITSLYSGEVVSGKDLDIF